MTAALFISGQQQSGWTYLAILGIIAAIIWFLWVLNKIIIHFFPSTKNAHAAGGNALMRLDAQFFPGRDHVLEAFEREEVDQDDEGDPPTTTGRK